MSICGYLQYQKKDRGGRKFWLLITDDATPKKWSFFLRSKDEQYRVIVNFVRQLRYNNVNVNEFNFLKKIRMDNAGEN